MRGGGGQAVWWEEVAWWEELGRQEKEELIASLDSIHKKIELGGGGLSEGKNERKTRRNGQNKNCCSSATLTLASHSGFRLMHRDARVEGSNPGKMVQGKMVQGIARNCCGNQISNNNFDFGK